MTVIRALACVLLLSPALGAEEPRQTHRIVVDHRPTPGEQLELGRRLAAQAKEARTRDERMRLVGVASAHLEDVPLRWPDATDAVLTARLLQADLYSAAELHRNAIEVLEKVRGSSAGSHRELDVALGLGMAHARLGETTKAVEEFTRAEHEDILSRKPLHQRAKALVEIAVFYRQIRSLEESAARYQRAALLPGIPEQAALGWLTAATEDWIAAGQTDRARASLALLETRVNAWNRTPLVSDADSIEKSFFSSAVTRLHSLLKERQ